MKNKIDLHSSTTEEHKAFYVQKVKGEIYERLGVDATEVEYILNYLYEKGHLKGETDERASMKRTYGRNDLA
ncbi:hypothetical protein L8C07_12630 [Paenibacillus sp. CMAA1739]|uniref:hypothetical protein n=1 Tax=Paenibacillus ottowii TaxID=2315729 RepID=UPI002DBB0449|nr:hypothetical protein [Paenibacillus sp. CMAA1739]MEC4566794.1 hypothetical protein [Paenibacillus sp. CMAA1739]